MRSILFLISLVSLFVFPEVILAQSLRKVQRIEGIPPKVQYRAITHDATGNMYVATSVDVFMIPANSNKAQPMSAGVNIMDIDWTRDEGLIMLAKEGMIRFVNTGKIIMLDSASEATCMDVNKSSIWVGTSNGVYTVSIDKEKILEHYSTNDGVMLDNHVYFIHTDPFNVRWIGTKKGVVRISGKKWKLYEPEQAVTAITSTGEGAWMAADQNMWLVNSYNRWFPIDAWKDLVSGPVRALSSDSKGIIYIASDILVKYDPFQEKKVTMTEDSNAAQFILLAQEPKGGVVMASHDGIAKVVEDTTRVIPQVTISGTGLSAVVNVISGPVCQGMSTGHVAAKVSGGQAPYTFQWSNNATTQELEGLMPGLYQVTITDASGNEVLASAIVSSSPALNAVAKAEGNASDKLASNGKASVQVTGGVKPYQILWDNNETQPTAIALKEGTHSVRVMDENGCLATANVTINADKVLKSLDISTIELGQTIRLDQLFFEADSATIQPSSFAMLEEIFEFLKTHDKVIIEIGGHTNSLPEDAYCDKLSTDRARNVALYLYEKGIPQSRISYKGYGKRQPIATNQTVEGRRRNQRVEIKIVSL